MNHIFLKIGTAFLLRLYWLPKHIFVSQDGIIFAYITYMDTSTTKQKVVKKSRLYDLGLNI